MVRGRLRTPQTVVDDPGRVCARGRSGRWSGMICGVVARRLPKLWWPPRVGSTVDST
jgi:hypothetical protein